MAIANQGQGAPLRLDLENEWVWRGQQLLQLTPKAFAVLRYLVEHPSRLVSKEELLQAVWLDTVVSEWALTTCIREIRKALGEEVQTPQYLATAHRRGYRFIGPLTTSPRCGSKTLTTIPSTYRFIGPLTISPPPVQSAKFQVQGSKSEPTPSPQPPAPSFVGREAELAQLHRWLAKALAGERQIVFVTGEPGLGKTTVVEAFLEQVAANGGLWIGRGQCIEQYGVGEAYLPVLDALGRLCRELGGEYLIELLGQYAPTWLVQLPALLSAAEPEALQRKVMGATRERMLREIAEALEALTIERPLVLWLEDLHWSDYSTLDLLSFLARRREKARLLVLGTYRPVEALGHGHPLHAVKQELQLHHHCRELRLGLLTEGDVAEYLTQRFAVGGGAWRAVLLQDLARRIHRRTEGNPLFLVNTMDYLIAQGAVVEISGRWRLDGKLAVVEAGVPEGLQELIERQIERLSPEDQRMLEVASVAGAEFSAAAVAAGLEAEAGEVEARCAELVRREQFLRARGVSEWPDGTVAARYGFLHALYQQVVYERVTAGRRIRLHKRIGEREEQAYGTRAGEIAAELAVHCERGRDHRRAIQYLRQASENAMRRSAYREAISLLTKGLELLKTLPDTPLLARAHYVLGNALYLLGKFAPAREHLERAMALYNL